MRERNVYRLPPCPAYDVEGMESWLSDMSAEGLELDREGFFCGVATFRRVENPRRLRYRLEAAPARTGGNAAPSVSFADSSLQEGALDEMNAGQCGDAGGYGSCAYLAGPWDIFAPLGQLR